MTSGLEEKLDKILGNDYRVNCYEDDSCDVEFWSPVGEDCPVGLNGKTLRELADDAKKAYEAFDPEDHAAQIYHAKHYGSEEDKRFYAGEPERLHDLLEDAESIKESYRDIWQKLEAAANAEATT